VLLAILEKAEVIGPLYEENGMRLPKGTVAAGYQNFLICIEMFFAAVTLKYAFPVNVRECYLIKTFDRYVQIPVTNCQYLLQVYSGGSSGDGPGRSVTMQSISSSLKVLNFKLKNMSRFILKCLNV
jgi:hypothetical protein